MALREEELEAIFEVIEAFIKADRHPGKATYRDLAKKKIDCINLIAFGETNGSD